jgi:hypothetical protein
MRDEPPPLRRKRCRRQLVCQWDESAVELSTVPVTILSGQLPDAFMQVFPSMLTTGPSDQRRERVRFALPSKVEQVARSGNGLSRRLGKQVPCAFLLQPHAHIVPSKTVQELFELNIAEQSLNRAGLTMSGW